MTIAAVIILIRPGVRIAQTAFSHIQKKVIFMLLIFYRERGQRGNDYTWDRPILDGDRLICC